MKLNFSYFQDKEGHYHICNIHPDHMVRHEGKGLWVPDGTAVEVEQAYYRTEAPENVYSYWMNPEHVPNFRIKSHHECNVSFYWAQLLDLSNIPKPRWEDPSPILVTLEINPKTSYCIYD